MFPAPFSQLIACGLLDKNSIRQTDDGFFAAAVSLGDLLLNAGIPALYNAQGEERRCERYLDDWHLYAIMENGETVCSLFKMREQESDAALPADGDTPGVTICFIAFDAALLIRSLKTPSMPNLQSLYLEIDRVVARRGQKHHPLLKIYWSQSPSQAPYLVARMYTQHAASFAQDGMLPVPQHYAATYHNNRRLRRFIDQNNIAASRTICDHAFIYITDPQHLSPQEALAILATHTANTSFHSFAAEVQFHARCLMPAFRLPFLKKSPYDSAVRADMTIDTGRLHLLFPFYHNQSRWLRAQQKYHPHT